MQPALDVAERLRTDFVDPLLALDSGSNQTDVAQRTQVLRRCGLAQLEALDQLTHGSWVFEQQIEDLSSMAFGESAERGFKSDHVQYIPDKLYA